MGSSRFSIVVSIWSHRHRLVKVLPTGRRFEIRSKPLSIMANRRNDRQFSNEAISVHVKKRISISSIVSNVELPVVSTIFSTVSMPGLIFGGMLQGDEFKIGGGYSRFPMSQMKPNRDHECPFLVKIKAQREVVISSNCDQNEKVSNATQATTTTECRAGCRRRPCRT